VSFDAGWTQRSFPGDWTAWSGGTAMASSVAGARATFRFTGTAVTWIGGRGVAGGIARIYLDGQLVKDLSLYGISEETDTRLYSLRGLEPGSHTLVIEVSAEREPDAQGNEVVVDAFDVPAPVVSRLQDSDSDISYSGTWKQVNGWIEDPEKPWSGRSITQSAEAGATATLRFRGTGIGLVGYRGPEGGIARLSIDGVVVGEIDTYLNSPQLRATVFAKDGLADGEHTLTIEVTGTRSPSATDSLIRLDAFDVTMTGRRYEEWDPAVRYTGQWNGNRNRPWSEAYAETSFDPGARATFTFTGTGVRWIGCAKGSIGIARVYLDGEFVEEIDGFFWPAEDYQRTMFEARGLTPGEHTLAVEATGRKNEWAGLNYVVVDAFDVLP
jgi:hypothetical protein